MANKPINIGDRFGRLTVISEGLKAPSGVISDEIWRECACDCGNVKKFRSHWLRSGKTQSCGCLRIQAVKMRGFLITGGMHKSIEYQTWCGIKRRCFDKKEPGYANYGARGITVCERWRTSFLNFYADMGKRPENTSIDRIDNSGDYTPENCRWATDIEQANNKSNNRRVQLGDECLTVAEWSRKTGIPKSTIMNRLNRGVIPARALSKERCKRQSQPDAAAWVKEGE